MLTEFLELMKQELALSLLLFILLIFKIAGYGKDPERWNTLVNLLLLINLGIGLLHHTTGALFNGMFTVTSLTIFQKNILNLGMVVVSFLANPFIRRHHHLPEFYMLMTATLLGMFFMISSGHMLLFYLGLELATIPLAALANFNLHRNSSSEGGMKMILSSAFSSALLLLGVSFLYGTTGSLAFRELSALTLEGPLQLTAFVLLFTGFAFKLSAVPFHFWTADVYEGAPVPVAAYLSVVSKAAVAFVFTSVLYSVFGAAYPVWYTLLTTVAALTIGTGNLFALRQQNMKRFLAFSSIAQVGFILVGMSAGNREAHASVVYFLLIYLFSNLAAFNVVGLMSAQAGKENIYDYKGLYKSNPVLAWALTIALFSLAGVPPTAGFFGKLFLLTSGASTGNYLLAGFAALNMVVSMYYYLRIVKVMFMEEAEHPLLRIEMNPYPAAALVLCLAGILVTGFSGSVYSYIHQLCFGIF